MRLLALVLFTFIALGFTSCATRVQRTYGDPSPEREATIPSEEEGKSEEIERTERKIVDPW